MKGLFQQPNSSSFLRLLGLLPGALFRNGMWFLQLDGAVAFSHIYAAMTLSWSYAAGLVQARSGPEQALLCIQLSVQLSMAADSARLVGHNAKRMVRMLASMHI